MADAASAAAAAKKQRRQERLAKIVALNDQLRTTGVGGEILATRGVNALGPVHLQQILKKMAGPEGLEADEKYYGEKDRGKFMYDGEGDPLED